MSTLGRVNCAILGARGLVAQRLLQRLVNHHWLIPTHVFGSKESDGIWVDEIPWSFNELRPDLPDIIVREMGESDELASELISQGVRIVFSALPDYPASMIERDLARSGLVVLSHSTIHRHTESVPLVVPEVNPEHLALLEKQHEFGSGALVACSNCMVVPLAISLAPIVEHFPVRSIDILTEQSVSGAGRVVLERYREGIMPPSEIIGESESVESELRRILVKRDSSLSTTAEIEISAECKRFPREFGHSATVTVDFDKKVSAHEIVEAWSDFQSLVQSLDLPSATEKPAIFVSESDILTPVIKSKSLGETEYNLQKSMDVSISDITVSEGKLCFKVASDNTVRGAAGNSILLAEMMLAQSIIHDSENPLKSSQNIR